MVHLDEPRGGSEDNIYCNCISKKNLNFNQITFQVWLLGDQIIKFIIYYPVPKSNAINQDFIAFNYKNYITTKPKEEIGWVVYTSEGITLTQGYDFVAPAQAFKILNRCIKLLAFS